MSHEMTVLIVDSGTSISTKSFEHRYLLACGTVLGGRILESVLPPVAILVTRRRAVFGPVPEQPSAAVYCER